MNQRISRFLKMALAVAVAAALMAGGGCLKSANTGTETQTTQTYNLSGMSNDINALKTWKDAANSRLTTIEAVIAGGSSGATKAEMQAVQSDIVSLRAQISAIQPTDISGLTAQVSTIQGKIAAVETTLTAYGADIHTLETDYAALKTAFDVLVARVTAQEAEIASLKTRVAALETPATTPPATTPVTAAESVQISLIWLDTMTATTSLTGVSPNTRYIALNYKNTANKQFTGVKISFAVLVGAGITLAPANNITCYAVPVSPLTIWARSSAATNVYSFVNFQGLTINALAEDTILLEVTVGYGGAGSMSIALAKVL